MPVFINLAVPDYLRPILRDRCKKMLILPGSKWHYTSQAVGLDETYEKIGIKSLIPDNLFARYDKNTRCAT